MFNLNSSPEISGLLLKISCAMHEVFKIYCMQRLGNRNCKYDSKD